MWIGQQVETPSFIKNGSELTYKLTVINNGDSDATEISIENEFNSDYLEIIDSTHEYSSESSNKMVWRVPSMPAGAATEITYRARVKSVRAGTDIVSEVFVSERETDNNEADNRDTITVTTSSKSRSKKNKDRTEEVR